MLETFINTPIKINYLKTLDGVLSTFLQTSVVQSSKT